MLSQNYGNSRKYLIRYKKTLRNKQFLLHDSGPPPQSCCVEDPDSEEEQKEEVVPVVIVFATWKNIKTLCHSSIWFVNDTFKTTSNIFAQIFTIIGLPECTDHSEEVVAVFEYTYMIERQLVYLSLQCGTTTIDRAEQDFPWVKVGLFQQKKKKKKQLRISF